MDLVSAGRPVTFDTIINVLMNTYVSMLFNFMPRKDVVPTIRQHTEMVIEQILAAKMHEEENDFEPIPEIPLQ
jgi:predicted HicB family RNase H-like nuclease